MDRELAEYLRTMSVVVISNADIILKLADMTDIDEADRKKHVLACSEKIMTFAKEIKRIIGKI